MLTLYGSGRSRWVRPLWLLRELGLEHRAVAVDRAGGELDSPAFRALNPTGRIPVLVHDGVAISESAAIVTYLADRFGRGRFIPAAGGLDRALHDQWLCRVLTEVEPPIWTLHKQINKGVGDAAAGERAARDTLEVAAVFERVMEERAFVAGDHLMAVDVVLGHLLTWVVVQPLLAELPALRAYRDRLVRRPGFPAELYRSVPFLEHAFNQRELRETL